MIHVVTGAPCSGKTTYVHEHAKAGDIIIDFDAIATALGAEPYEAEGNIFTAAVKARLAAIDAALTCDGDSWIIDTIHDSKYQENEDLMKGVDSVRRPADLRGPSTGSRNGTKAGKETR